jgi:hypothetical protein
MFQATPYQVRAISKMVRGNYFLAWEPGCGKTYPVLVASQFVNGPTLCVVPAHLRGQWAREAHKHAPLAHVRVLEILDERIRISPGVGDIVICSYEYVSHLPRWKELRRMKWAALAIDECHYLSNLSANRTRALLGLKENETHGLVYAADCVWFLSGTPFTFPHQIYPILSRSFPQAIQRPPRNGPGLMTPTEWEIEFCEVAPGKNGFGTKIVGACNVQDLRARLAPFLDKVKLVDAAHDLPGIIVDEIPVKCNLRELTDRLPPDILDAYEVLRSVLGDARISDDRKLAAIEDSGVVMAQLRHTISAAKIGASKEVLLGEVDAGHKKVLCVGWHRVPLQTLGQQLKCPVIYGSMTDKQKSMAIERFLDDPSCYFLFGQIGSIGTGVDGLQKVCHRLLFHEASWAYRDNKQAIHRIYRKGQTLPCHASFITLLGSVDTYVNRVLKRNAETVKSVLD